MTNKNKNENYHIDIEDENGCVHSWTLRFAFSKYMCIYVKDVCVIDIHKYHDHRYDIKCFFYKNFYIYYRECINSKKELYSAIQKLLEENL